MSDDPFGLQESYAEEEARIKAMPKFVKYESEPCPLCGRIRWQLFSDGSHTCEKCGWETPSPEPKEHYEDVLKGMSFPKEGIYWCNCGKPRCSVLIAKAFAHPASEASEPPGAER